MPNPNRLQSSVLLDSLGLALAKTKQAETGAGEKTFSLSRHRHRFPGVLYSHCISNLWRAFFFLFYAISMLYSICTLPFS